VASRIAAAGVVRKGMLITDRAVRQPPAEHGAGDDPGIEKRMGTQQRYARVSRVDRDADLFRPEFEVSGRNH